MISVTQNDSATLAPSQNTKSKDTASAEQARTFLLLQRLFPYTRFNWSRPTHPAIVALLNQNHLAKCILQLSLEQPSIPQDKFQQRVSYWRSEEHQARGIRTTVTLGKYIKRHFPQIPDHEIRDFVSLYAPIRYEFWETTEDIVRACEEGPYSCMQWGVNRNGPLVDHPYQVYAPELGWKICVGLKGDEIVSRALINNKVFVRTYEKTDSPRETVASTDMTAWLVSKGYVKKESWPRGTRLAAIKPKEVDSKYIFPWLDGDNKYAGYDGYSLVINAYGEYRLRFDDGTAEAGDKVTCERCDDRVDEDDLVSVQDEDYSCVCPECINNHYTAALGERGRFAYYRDSKVTEVNGMMYADDFMEENNIVPLKGGGYAKLEDTVYVEDEDEGEYFLRSECAYCEYQSKWLKKENTVEIEFCDETYTVEDGYEDEMIHQLEHDLAVKNGQLALEY